MLRSLTACAIAIAFVLAAVWLLGAPSPSSASGPATTALSERPMTAADVEAFLDGLVPLQIEQADIAGAVVTVVRDGQDFLIRLNKDLTFINKQELKARLREIPDGARVIIDGVRAHYVDHDAIEVIKEFCEAARHRGIVVECHRIHGITHS